jgi:hypothetical protein
MAARQGRAVSDDGPGIVGAVVIAVFELLQGPRKPPPLPEPPAPPMAPHELHTLWTCLSAGALAGCAYVTVFAAALTGKSAAALLAEFVQAPADPPAVLVIWCAVMVIAGVYLWVGLHNAAEGAYAGLWAFWSAALPIVALVVMALHAPGLFANPVVLGCVLVACSMAAMRVYLALRGGSAMRAVRRNIRRKNRPLRPARTRRWWRLFF